MESPKSQSLFPVLRPRADSERPRTIIVLGVSHGGTSMAAGALRCLDVFMGARVEGDTHEDVAFLPFRGPERIRKTIEKRNRTRSLWGWKMPDSIDYLPTVYSSLRAPRFVVVMRNPISVALSTERRLGLSAPAILRRTLAHYEKIDRFLDETTDPVLLASYETALKAPEAFVDALAAFVEIPDHLVRRKAAVAFIQPDGGYRPV